MDIKEVGELILGRWEAIDKRYVIYYKTREFAGLQDCLIKMPMEEWIQLKHDIKNLTGAGQKDLNTTTATN